jgi:hypothetical protein
MVGGAAIEAAKLGTDLLYLGEGAMLGSFAVLILFGLLVVGLESSCDRKERKRGQLDASISDDHCNHRSETLQKIRSILLSSYTPAERKAFSVSVHFRLRYFSPSCCDDIEKLLEQIDREQD